jgi:hypothetical protein
MIVGLHLFQDLLIARGDEQPGARAKGVEPKNGS